MPQSLARPDSASNQMLARVLSRPETHTTDRWSMPVAGAAILGMSALAWAILIQAGRMVASLAG